MAPALKEALAKVKQSRKAQQQENAKVQAFQLIAAAPQPQVSEQLLSRQIYIIYRTQ